ncbi:ribose ABC transporter substrate-binding protein RbsB [Paenibacillus sp. NEAU-GSW1]|uniref:ribose ABC transporter substrate-binding protein RbsB n=1 Tax=Paenibacillus sp. NEAU-GSW1 TaxID=2682486 RepID=UPI0012E0DD4E|nr:ribose ABC transporter substrate-binding protein RbsB [Paenibacillus sp. NEAU-GSW1]MUT67302.1 ribose ABC transporter substrate-binding protein RbsB [Paenibacillus sp. NEAU-GSW1]
MKKTSKLLSIGMIAALLLAGCSTTAPGTETTKEPEQGGAKTEGIKIGLAVSTQSNPFFVTLKEGAQQTATAESAELITVDAQDDAAKQASSIEDLIQQKVDVIIINPTDSAAIVPAVESANAAGIPVITVDRTADGGKVVSHIASDNKAGGVLAAKFIAEQLNGTGKVVELEGIPGSSAARERGAGFNEEIAKSSGIQVAAKQPADFDRAKGLTVMENILQGNKDIKAVFAHNDEMALGALKAIEAAGATGILVVGFDATDDAVKEVFAGKLSATVAQKPDLMGMLAVQTAIKIAKGEAVESSIPVELDLITKDSAK